MLPEETRKKLVKETATLGNILLGASVGSIITIGSYIYIRKTEWDDFDKYIEYATIAISVGLILFVLSWLFRGVLLNKLFGISRSDISGSIDELISKLEKGDIKELAYAIKDLYVLRTAHQIRWKVVMIAVILMGNILLAANAAMLVKQTKVFTEELERKKTSSFLNIDERLSSNEKFIQISAYIALPAHREKIGLPSDTNVNQFIFLLNRMGSLVETELIHDDLVEKYYKSTIQGFFVTPKLCGYYKSNTEIAPDSVSGLTLLGDWLANEEKSKCLN